MEITFSRHELKGLLQERFRQTHQGGHVPIVTKVELCGFPEAFLRVTCEGAEERKSACRNESQPTSRTACRGPVPPPEGTASRGEPSAREC